MRVDEVAADHSVLRILPVTGERPDPVDHAFRIFGLPLPVRQRAQALQQLVFLLPGLLPFLLEAAPGSKFLTLPRSALRSGDPAARAARPARPSALAAVAAPARSRVAASRRLATRGSRAAWWQSSSRRPRCPSPCRRPRSPRPETRASPSPKRASTAATVPLPVAGSHSAGDRSRPAR